MGRRLATAPSVLSIASDVTITAQHDEEGKATGPPRFEVVAYTGGPMKLGGFELPLVVDLEGMSFGKSLVANLDHDRSKRVGNITTKAIKGGQLVLAGTASAATPFRDEVVKSAADGFVWQASIEATIERITELAAGKTRQVNGQTITGPAYVVPQSTLKGFAFVSHGADDNTTVDIAAESTHSKGKDMDPELRAWIEEMLPGVDIDDLGDDALANLTANYNGRETKRPKHKKLDDITAERRAEADRQDRITELAADAMQENPHAIEAIRALADTAIDAKWEIDKFHLELFKAQMPRATAPRWSRRDNGRLNNRILEAAICQSLLATDLDKEYDEQTLQAAEDQFPNGIGLKQLYCIAAEANGCPNRHSFDVTLDVHRYAMGMVGKAREIQAAGFSTITLPNILSNVMNKFIRDAFNSVDPAWRSISAIRPVRDFKQTSTYSLTGDLDYEQLGPTGEIKHGTLGEETYTNQASTYAKMAAITRTDIINDDLGALMQVPRRLGRGGATKLNNVFWTTFLNNTGSFFTAGNKNVSTGAGSALDSAGAGLAAAEVIFMNQTDPDGQPLGLMPAILLIPPTLKTTALILTNSQLVVTGANTTRGATNIWDGRFQVVSSPYMENSAYTGFSTAAWYLLANPMDMPVIETVFLNGREAPVVETDDAEFNVLGVQMRGYHDFGCSLQEPRGGVRSAGS